MRHERKHFTPLCTPVDGSEYTSCKIMFYNILVFGVKICKEKGSFKKD